MYLIWVWTYAAIGRTQLDGDEFNDFSQWCVISSTFKTVVHIIVRTQCTPSALKSSVLLEGRTPGPQRQTKGNEIVESVFFRSERPGGNESLNRVQVGCSVYC